MNQSMKVVITVAVMAATFATWAEAGNTDPVAQSFERELSRQAAPVSVVTRGQVREDVLYRAFAQSLHSHDEVRPGFERVLRESEAVPLLAPQGYDDLLTAQFNAALWSDGGVPSARIPATNGAKQ